MNVVNFRTNGDLNKEVTPNDVDQLIKKLKQIKKDDLQTAASSKAEEVTSKGGLNARGNQAVLSMLMADDEDPDSWKVV